MLKELDDNSVDSVVTDPPYGLGKEPDIIEVMKDWIDKGYHEVKSKGGFMGKEWDAFVPQPILWKEVYRVLKHGGYALVACGTRTQDWMAASLRFAGFEVRDVITWHYGSGFPKSMDISKAIDKQAGAEREVISTRVKKAGDITSGNFKRGEEYPDKELSITAPSTPEAKQWEGWGTALKPATEFWTLVRKPLAESTVAENVLKHGTGGINIDGCRVEYEEGGSLATNPSLRTHINGGNGGNIISYEEERRVVTPNLQGRFPANLILYEFSAELLDEQTGILKSGTLKGTEYLKGKVQQNAYGSHKGHDSLKREGDSGGASRFFYVAKASKKERNAGLINSKKFKLKNNTPLEVINKINELLDQ